ncbi:hypothetical protein [Sphingosinicella terrae]|uniref:hypothetical protein n=1 Tax=Sphingosinicella terrae TaxID=2172047 RepID=UPI000E0CCDED|nr:hypothetical protein [Sphingosinicella terrae]
MRFLWLIAAALAPAQAAATQPGAAPVQAQRGVDDPRAFVAAQYDAYRRNPEAPPADPEFAYSDGLRALFDAYMAWTARHDDLIGSLDFDWWTNSQDWRVDRVELDVIEEGADRRTIVARFRNWEAPDEVRFAFVRQSGRWYLDDASSGDGEDGWVLSVLLAERPE